MSELSPTQWITQCAERLRLRWRTVEPAMLEEAAVEVWRDAKLRSLPPAEAAALWLRPVEGQPE